MTAKTLLDELRSLVAEEMHLLAQELEDSASGSQASRLEEICRTLDAASDLLNKHRAARPGRHDSGH